jgi:hypothetical protein
MRQSIDLLRLYPEQRRYLRDRLTTVRNRMLSTEPADRPTAEAAVTELYRHAGLPRPELVWHESPLAAAAAYGAHFQETRQRQIDEQLRLRPAWVRQVAAQVGDTPDYRARHLTVSQSFREMLGLRRQSNALRDVIGAAIRQPTRTWEPAPRQPRVTPEVAMGIGRLGFGGEWDRVVAMYGEERAVDLMRGAVTSLFSTMVRCDVEVGASTLGQLDELHPYLAIASGLLLLTRAKTRLAHLEAFMAIASSAGPWFATQHVAFLSERPVVCRVDPVGRPHGEDGPALAWPDGIRLFAWHGVLVPARAIEQPSSLTVAEIEAEPNVEIRRIMAERFGLDRYVTAPGSELVHEDETGRLWRRWLVRPRKWVAGGEAISMVEVINSTPEPDGTRKTYFLRVPGGMTTARQAVAWTFGLTAAEYRPAVET